MGGTIDRVQASSTWLFAGTTVDILVPTAATAGEFTLLRIGNPPGCWTPPHQHRNEDETVFVLAGTLRVETGNDAITIEAGQALVLPRGQLHRLGNAAAEQARLLVLCTPGGFDEFVQAAGRPVLDQGLSMTEAEIARLIEVAPRHGITLLPPDALRPASP